MAMSTTTPTLLTVVRSPACHFCADALDALAEIGADFPVTVEVVEAGEPRGEALVREHRAPMYPLVLLDGAFFSSGRLPRTKLRKALECRTTAVA